MRLGSAGSGAGKLAAERGGDVEGLVAASGAAAVEDVAVFGVGDDGVGFAGLADGLPVAEAEDALARPGGDAYAAGVLLGAVEPVGEAVVGGDVVDLGRGLVVPGGPGRGFIDADYRALIGRQDHAVGVVGVDPDLVVVVAAGCAFDGDPGFAGVYGSVGCGVDDVGGVGVGGIGGDGFEVPAAAPEAGFVVDLAPGGSGVVGEEDSAGRLGGGLGVAAAAAGGAELRGLRCRRLRPRGVWGWSWRRRCRSCLRRDRWAGRRRAASRCRRRRLIYRGREPGM